MKKNMILLFAFIFFILLGVAAFNANSIKDNLTDLIMVPGVEVGSEFHSRASSTSKSGGGQGVGSAGMDVSGTLYPKIRFTSEDGATHHFVSSLSKTSIPQDNLQVMYPKGRPEEAEVVSFFNIWFKALIPAILAGVFLFLLLIFSLL